MKVLLVGGIALSLEENEDLLAIKTASVLNISFEDIKELEVLRKAIDARRNKPPHFVYVLKITISPADYHLPSALKRGIQVMEIADQKEMPHLHCVSPPERPVVIIGAGPAGLFAAYLLSLRGVPSFIIERGVPVEERIKDVRNFWEKGILNCHSNVFFGEGGAGTFSDGKLTNRSRNPYSFWVKKIFVEMGAPPEILTEAKPHIGTDKLRQILVRFRSRLIDMGCRIEFNAQATDFLIEHGDVRAVTVNKRDEIKTNHVILAIGQSADDTYQTLFENGVDLETKPFAMGVRIEHPQKLINSIQYGKWCNHPKLPPAEYFISASLAELNRSVYTFCMCPGGTVIGCGAFEGFLATNGMSDSERSGEFANSAVVVNVRVDDFMQDKKPLSGLVFRQRWERKAFLAGGNNYNAPAQKTIDFLEGKKAGVLGRTSYRPGVQAVDLQKILPDFVSDSLKKGIREFDKKMSGFISEESHLIGVETRTSSPVRICRRNDGQSSSVRGIYPCGEGAGYSGGIISSALDGIQAAQKLIENLN